MTRAHMFVWTNQPRGNAVQVTQLPAAGAAHEIKIHIAGAPARCAWALGVHVAVLPQSRAGSPRRPRKPAWRMLRMRESGGVESYGMESKKQHQVQALLSCFRGCAVPS